MDILFSAFAAVLGTATVVVAMMRTREPDVKPQPLPFFTLVAKSTGVACPLDRIEPGFVVSSGGEPGVLYSPYTQANQAADSINGRPGLKAWYIADTGPGGGLRNACKAPASCVKAELALLTAQVERFEVKPIVEGCSNSVEIAFEMGVIADDQLAGLKTTAPSQVQPIGISVTK
ncbi:hypothetical protein [Bosea sp. CRIB-10]|uniref:hypothetical protein n=1 Tax=Bosea sp. CRIB-10 TaxID=378404 RepID=UPI001113C599|nr:hypothetical protein [Bosea sp. CRIB-10]